MTAGNTSVPSSLDVGELIEKLTQQRDLYRQLKDLSDRQSELIESGATEQLLSLLSQRQQLVDELGRVAGALEPFKQRWAELSQQIGETDRERVNGLLEEVEGLLGGILEQDDRDRAQLQGSRDQVGGELKRMHHTGQAASAYRAAPSAGAAARFTDRRG